MDEKIRRARQITAIYLLMRARAYIAAASPNQDGMLMALDKILSEVLVADYEHCKAALEKTQPLPGWATELIIAMVQAYEAGVAAIDLGQFVPEDMIDSEGKTADGNASAGANDGSRVDAADQRGQPRDLGRRDYKAGGHEDGIRSGGTRDGDLVAAGRNRSDGFRGRDFSYHQKRLGGFPWLGAEPLRATIEPVAEATTRQMRTTQVLASGHFFETKIDWGNKTMEYTLWPPYSCPHGTASLMHGTLAMLNVEAVNEQWFHNVAACILAQFTAQAERKFPLYKRAPNHAECS